MINKSFLSRVQIFSGLSAADLGRLLEIVSERTYRRDEVVFHAGDPGSTLFILKTGSVKIAICSSDGREDILKVLYPGDFFGEMSILDGQHRSATVRAVEKSASLVITREQFVELIVDYPQIALNMLTMMCRRIRKTDEKIASLRFADSYGKVARVLLDLAEERGTNTERGMFVANALSRQELADLAGISRETFTRTLLEFQKNGCICVEGRDVTILNEATLRREML